MSGSEKKSGPFRSQDRAGQPAGDECSGIDIYAVRANFGLPASAYARERRPYRNRSDRKETRRGSTKDLLHAAASTEPPGAPPHDKRNTGRRSDKDAARQKTADAFAATPSRTPRRPPCSCGRASMVRHRCRKNAGFRDLHCATTNRQWTDRARTGRACPRGCPSARRTPSETDFRQGARRRRASQARDPHNRRA